MDTTQALEAGGHITARLLGTLLTSTAIQTGGLGIKPFNLRQALRLIPVPTQVGAISIGSAAPLGATK